MSQTFALSGTSIGDIYGHAFSHNTNNSTIHIHTAASPSPSSTATRYARGSIPADITSSIGHDREVEELVVLLTQGSEGGKRSRICILGPGGMRKAIKAINHPEIKRCYLQRNLIFVPCAEAKSAPLLLDILISALEITRDTYNTLDDIVDELRSSDLPLLLLLDNFETPLYPSSAKKQVEKILHAIEEIPHVALLVTMRDNNAACPVGIPWIERRIGPLDSHTSFRLYTEIYPNARDDPDLAELLEKLGYMPLAVTLMAKLGKTTESSARQLTESFRAVERELLGSRNGVNVCIRLSLESPMIQRTPDASVLLVIISMLPTGTTSKALENYWAATLSDLPATLEALVTLSLLEHRSAAYFVPPAIQSYILDPSRISKDVSPLLVQAACKFLKDHNSSKTGDPAYLAHKAARCSMQVNLQTILLNTTDSDSDIINALMTLALHQSMMRGPTVLNFEVIKHAIKLVGGIQDKKLHGDVSLCYGAILENLDQRRDALKQYKLARKAFIKASETRSAALVLHNIAHLSKSKFTKLPRLKQAQIELSYITNPVALALIRQCPLLYPLFRRKPQAPNEDIVRCLFKISDFYSSRGNYSRSIILLTRVRGLCSDFPSLGQCCAEKLATAHYLLGQYDEAEKWGLSSYEECQQMGIATSATARALGRIYISKGNYAKAIKHLDEALKIARSCGCYSLYIGSLLVDLGRAHWKRG
ncbi:hypothetical protein C8J56DRAFT_390324 [Mycena floridula]|nr:hypothetical protein C8J56DRAFT_390324 [Mycena floridula]